MIKSVTGVRGELLRYLDEVTEDAFSKPESYERFLTTTSELIDRLLQAERQRVEVRILDYLSERTKGYDSIEPDDPRAPAAKSMSATTEAVIAEVLDRIRAIRPGVD